MKKKGLMLCSSFLLAFSACQNDSEIMDEKDNASFNQKEITSCFFEVSLAESSSSRTVITDLDVQWKTGDELGLFCGEIEGNSPNVKFQVMGDGESSAIQSQGEMSWKWDENTFVYGYYPYNEGQKTAGQLNFSLPDTQEQADANATQLSKYDYLVALPVACPNANIKLNFQHIMAWIDLKISNTDNKELTVQSVDVTTGGQDLVKNGTINITGLGTDLNQAFSSNGKVEKLSVSASGDWAVVQPGGIITLRMAIFPCDLAGKTLTITVHTGSGDMEVSKTGQLLDMGKRYTANISLFLPALDVDKTSLSFAATGGEETINITTNMNWQLVDNPDWITLTPATGTGNESVKVTASPYSGTEPRTGTMKLQSVDETKVIEITVSQNSSSAGVPDQGDGGELQ